MIRLASLLPTATFGLASGTTLAIKTNVQSNSGQASSSADVDQVTPDTRENVAPNSVDNSNMNSDGTVLHPNGSSMDHEETTKDKVRKSTMRRDGHYPGVSKKIRTGDSISNGAETKTDDTTQ